MTKTNLSRVYRAYIDCLNRQDWINLGKFVHGEVSHNGQRVGVTGYREMLERDFRDIPDLHFEIQLLISNPPLSPAGCTSTAHPGRGFLAFQSTAAGFPLLKMCFMNSRKKELLKSGQ